MDKNENIPLVTYLLKNLILDDYASAIDIITSNEFNPNEKGMAWGAPALTAVIVVMASSAKDIDENGLREVIKGIINHKDFDPNVADNNGDTVLMHIAIHPEFNWVVPMILATGKVNFSLKNFMHKTILEIAEGNNNVIFRNMVLGGGRKGTPKKMPGLKKKQQPKAEIVSINFNTNKSILNRIDAIFDADEKKNPVSLYGLLTAFFKGDYDTAIQIAKDVNFNPNSFDRFDEPCLTSLIYYSQDANVTYDEEMFKKVADAIISNRRFDVNAIDSDCNTVLMASMGFPKLRWLTEKLFSLQSARIDIINDSGENIREIADNCGNGEFYNKLVMKAFETANIVE